MTSSIVNAALQMMADQVTGREYFLKAKANGWL